METSLLSLGYVASAITFLAYLMRSHMRLRQVAIASNIVFVIYGASLRMWPVLILHAALLILNAIRLREIVLTQRAVAAALDRTDLSLEWLAPYMKRVRFGPGETIFRKGDRADKVYCVLKGSIEIDEIGVLLGPRTLLGEIGVFSPTHTRTLGASTPNGVSLLVITREELLGLYRHHPEFGIYLLQLITKRLLENEALRHAHEFTLLHVSDSIVADD